MDTSLPQSATDLLYEEAVGPSPILTPERGLSASRLGENAGGAPAPALAGAGMDKSDSRQIIN